MTCQCGVPRSEEPRTPPTSLKAEGVQSVLVPLPMLVAVVVPEQVRPRTVWSTADWTFVGTSNSTQSLLCVWVM